MKIITYTSANAPEAKRWVAYFLVPVKPSKDPKQISPDAADEAVTECFPAKPSAEGLMPYSFFGTTEDEATSAAQRAWDSSFGKRQQRIDEVAAKTAAKKAGKAVAA